MARARFLIIVAAALAACAMAGCAGRSPPSAAEVDAAAQADRAQLVVSGREIAAMRCSDCHAIDGASESPLAGAPKLSEMADRYDLKVLADEFAAGVHVGGGAMPKFQLSLDEIDALTAYLEAVAEPKAP